MKKLIDTVGPYEVYIHCYENPNEKDQYEMVIRVMQGSNLATPLVALNAIGLSIGNYALWRLVKPKIQEWIDGNPKRRECRGDSGSSQIYIMTACYTQPQIEREYQAFLELWEWLKHAATTPNPKAMIVKRTLKELGFK